MSRSRSFRSNTSIRPPRLLPVLESKHLEEVRKKKKKPFDWRDNDQSTCSTVKTSISARQCTTCVAHTAWQRLLKHFFCYYFFLVIFIPVCCWLAAKCEPERYWWVQGSFVVNPTTHVTSANARFKVALLSILQYAVCNIHRALKYRYLAVHGARTACGAQESKTNYKKV